MLQVTLLVLITRQKIIAGDVLFNGSIGRTDLPKGNYQDLIDSINHHLLTLDDSYIVHCGHGPDTSIGHERKTNPFFKCLANQLKNFDEVIELSENNLTNNRVPIAAIIYDYKNQNYS